MHWLWGFAAKSVRVFATARSLESMSNFAEKCIKTFVLDTTVNDSIKALKDGIKKLIGLKLNILYNNVGASKCFSIFGSTSQSS